MASTFIVGTDDADLLNGAAGNDTIRGLGGDDTINGSEGNDDLDGGEGNDLLIGGAGSDTIQGGLQSDTIQGGDGADVLRGGKGHDAIEGGAGNDTIYSGLGEDTLTGGGGSDVFIVRGADENFPGAILTPVITDFTAGSDTIGVQGVTADEIADALAAQEVDEDGNVTITIGGATITVEGVTALGVDDVKTEDDATTGETVGQTFTLTTGIDIVDGTEGNDTIAGTDTTFNLGDDIDGGAGTDRLNITAAATLDAVDVENVELVYARFTAGTGLDASSFTGVTQLWNDRSAVDLTFDNVASGTVVGLNKTSGDLAVNFDGAGDETIAVVGVGTGAVNIGTAVESLSILAQGEASNLGAIQTSDETESVSVDAEVDLTVANIAGTAITDVSVEGAGEVELTSLAGATVLETLTYTGSGSLTVGGTLAATVETVDASEATGGIDVTSGANTTSITGGSGDDTINIASFVYGTATTAVVDAGDGTDTLEVATSAAVVAAATDSLLNFEVLSVGGANQTYNTSLVAGIVAIETDTTGTLTLNNLNAARAGDITLGADVTTLTLGVTNATNPGTDDTVSLTFDSGVDVTTLTIDGVETLNLSADGATALATVGAIADSSTRLDVVNISGDGDFSFTLGTTALSISEVDGSAATGDLTIDVSAETADGIAVTGGAGDDTFTGTSVNDIIVGGAGDDTIDGGAGDDTLTGGDGEDEFALGGAGETDTITDFTADDTIDFGAVTAAQTDDIIFGTAAIAGTAISTGAINVYEDDGDTIVQVVITTAGAGTADDEIASFVLQGITGLEAGDLESDGDTIVLA